MAYKVKLEIFEGPLDLLLYLIKKNEVDIYDIPIASITDQYLEYIDVLQSMNLELAGEFLLMAATLVHIKSKMLLPLPEEGEEEEEEGIDPRAELVRKLLEYKRYKDAAISLDSRMLLGRDVFTRGMPVPIDELEEDMDDAAALVDATILDLIEAFRDMIKRMPEPYEVDITVDRFRVADKINQVMEVLTRERSVLFKDLFPPSASKGEVVVTFLALLELAKLVLIRVNQTDDGVIRVYKNEGQAAHTGVVSITAEKSEIAAANEGDETL